MTHAFFQPPEGGTYALRQVRRRSVLTSVSGGSVSAQSDVETQMAQVITFLRDKGAMTPAAIAEATGISRRTLARLLADAVSSRRLLRQARYATDPAARYALAEESSS